MTPSNPAEGQNPIQALWIGYQARNWHWHAQPQRGREGGRGREREGERERETDGIRGPPGPRTHSHPHCVNCAGRNQITLDWNGIITNRTESCGSKTDYTELVDYTELDYMRQIKTLAERGWNRWHWIKVDGIRLYWTEPGFDCKRGSVTVELLVIEL